MPVLTDRALVNVQTPLIGLLLRSPLTPLYCKEVTLGLLPTRMSYLPLTNHRLFSWSHLESPAGACLKAPGRVP